MSNEVFNEGPTTSQHIESTDDEHFQNTTFKLKRTRSMGLLDNFITNNTPINSNPPSSTSTPLSATSNSGGRIQNTKLISGSFIPKETLSKLNLSTNNGPVPTSTPPTSTPHHSHNASTLPYSPQSFQSDDFSDDLYNSEDSISSSSNSSICLTPKHQLKKLNQLNHSNNSNHNNDQAQSSSNQPDLTNLLHDDIDVKDSPESHVDYLTHKWDEVEISKSWKYITERRSNVAESARLENASWRTWAQTRLGLKTISPEELNWSKDADVTWLYGPVIKNNNNNKNNTNINNNNNNTPFPPRNNSVDNNSFKNVADNRSNSNDNINNPTFNEINDFNDTGNALLNNNNNNNNTFITNSLDSCDNSDNDVIQQQQQHQTQTSCGDHLKSILKKKSNVEKMISDASYSRLQHLLASREKCFSLKNHSNGNQSYSDSSPVLEPSSLHSVPSNSTIINNTYNTSSLNINPKDSVNSISTITSNKILSSSSKIKSSLKNSSINITKNIMHKVSNNVNTSFESSVSKKEKKRIHFNMRVDQCIALDDPHNCQSDTQYVDSSDESDNYPVSKMVSSTYKEDTDNFADDDNNYHNSGINNMINLASSDSDSDSDSEDEGFVLNPTINLPSHATILASQLINNNHINDSKNSINEIATIAPLPATTLKFGSDDEHYESKKKSSMTSYNTKANRGYADYYDYNTARKNSSNSGIYSINDATTINNTITNSTRTDVQMFDVPVDCQLDDTDNNHSDDINLDINSPINNNGGFTFSNNSSVNASPLILSSELPLTIPNNLPNLSNFSNLSFSSSSNIVDTPASLRNSLPTIDTANDNVQHIERMNSDCESSDDSNDFIELKKSASIGSTQSLTSIKSGLSGLDLTTTGLKRSTGIGSKPQLFQLGNLNPVSSSTPSFSNTLNSFADIGTGFNNRKKFSFANSDSESESDHDDKMINDSKGYNHLHKRPNNNNNPYMNNQMDDDIEMMDDNQHSKLLLNAVKKSQFDNNLKNYSLSDINKKFGSLSSLNSGSSIGNLNNPGRPSRGKVGGFSFGGDSDSDSDSY